ncbi:hypothetical protein IWQ60_005335 [Tieghemiomyces parasiticus]|uniref:DH domain-containing protein n=1 Tax=Tieghemiomyces parasiticus TaxID=78921 RepID=A0A9W8A6K6_9FUNG|nr:hypothetical protein IWQ60_005335 [Tieghemiomyces parasiticus]
MSDSAPKSVDAISSGSASTRSLPIPNSASPPVEPEAIPPAHPSPATTPPQTHPLQLATTLPSPTRLSRTNSNVSDVTATATDVPSELAVDSLTGHPSSQHASTTNIVGAPVTPPPSHQASATSNDPSAAATPVATTTLPPCPSATPAAEDMPTLPRLSAISTCSPELLPANRFLATPSSPNNEEKKSTAQPSDDRSSLNEEIEALVDDDGNIYLHPGKDVDMVDIAEPAISSDSDFMELYLRKSLPAPPRENKTMVSAAAGAPAIPPVPVTETMATPTLSRKSSRAVADFRQLTLTRHDMRKHIITEISATERSFYDCFNEVRVVWMDPIFDGILNQNPIMDPAEARTLFLGVDELLDHSATLRDELEEVANTQSPDASIAEVFLREQRQWKAFPRTIRNFKAAQGVIKRALATRSFAKFQQDVMRNKTTKNDTLSSLLILPVQRITRYPLLLDKLLKQTPPSHWEHALLQQAIELISRYATESNLGAREDMAHSPVMALTKPLRHVPLMVYRPSRKFITETMVREVRTDSTRRLFLFDDILLMAHCPASRGWSSMSRRTWVCDLVIDLTELSVLTQTCVEGNKHVTILSIEGGDPVSRAGSIDRRISTLSALPDPDTPFPNMVVGNAGITSTTVTLATIRSSAIGSNSPHPHLGPTSPFLLPSPPHDQTAFPFDQFQSGGLYASPVAPGASNTTAPKSPSVPASALPSAPAVPSVPATPTTPATGLTRARSDAGDSMVSRTVGKPSHSLSLVTSLSFIITPTGEKQTILPTQDPQYFTLQHTTSEAQKSFATALESQITKILLSKYVPAPFN